MAAPRPAKVAKVSLPIKLPPATAAPRPAKVSPPIKLPVPVLDKRLSISSSKVLPILSALHAVLPDLAAVQLPGPPRHRHHPALVTRQPSKVRHLRFPCRTIYDLIPPSQAAQEAHSRRFKPLKLSSVVSSSTKPRSILKKGTGTSSGHRGGPTYHMRQLKVRNPSLSLAPRRCVRKMTSRFRRLPAETRGQAPRPAIVEDRSSSAHHHRRIRSTKTVSTYYHFPLEKAPGNFPGKSGEISQGSDVFARRSNRSLGSWKLRIKKHL